MEFKLHMNEHTLSCLEEKDIYAAMVITRNFMSMGYYPSCRTVQVYISQVFTCQEDPEELESPWTLLHDLLDSYGLLPFQSLESLFDKTHKRHSNSFVEMCKTCLCDLNGDPTSYTQKRAFQMLLLLWKVLDLDIKQSQLQDCMIFKIFDKYAFKSWMDEMGNYLQDTPQLCLEFMRICALWIQLFIYVGLQKDSTLDRSLVFNETRNLLLRCSDERLLLFFTYFEDPLIESCIIDNYLESICVYKKTGKAMLGNDFSIKKLIMQLEQSQPAKTVTTAEHCILLGRLVLKALQLYPESVKGQDLATAFGLAFDRLSKNNNQQDFEIFRLCKRLILESEL